MIAAKLTVTILPIVLTVVVATFPVAKADYCAGPPPSVDISHETAATAAGDPSRARLDIGIGEQVVCSVDDWVDNDINTQTHQFEADGMGAVSWSCSIGSGKLTSTTGSSTIFIGDYSPGSVVIGISAADAGSLFNDPSSATASVTFSVKAPESLWVVFKSDLWSGNTGNNYFGAWSKFDVTVKPTTVSFYRAYFDEDIPYNYFNWRDAQQTSDCWGGYDSYFGVPENNQGTDELNMKTYGVPSGRPPVAYLGGQTWGLTKYIPLTYKNGSNQWTPWYRDSQGRSLDIHIDNFVGGDGSNISNLQFFCDNAAQGGWQGPWLLQ